MADGRIAGLHVAAINSHRGRQASRSIQPLRARHERTATRSPHVAYFIPSREGSGGAERSLEAMAPLLAREIRLTIITFTGDEPTAQTTDANGVDYIDLGTAGRRPDTVRSLREVLRRLTPDLLHTTLLDADLPGAAASVGSGVPVVTSLVNDNHGRSVLRPLGLGAAKRGAVWAAHAVAARRAVRHHALTHHVADVMGRRLGVPPTRIDVIPRGRSADHLGRRTDERRRAARTMLGVDDDRPLVMAAARHEYQKGLDLLIDAFPMIQAALPSATLRIGGRTGNDTPRIMAALERAGLDAGTTLLGQRDDVADLMCAADVWCVPSRWEGFGGILVEAMALETPVVASDIPPIREVAGEPPVFALVPPERPDAMAARVIEVLTSPAETADRVSRGRQRFVENFTIEATTTEMLSFYDRALSAP